MVAWSWLFAKKKENGKGPETRPTEEGAHQQDLKLIIFLGHKKTKITKRKI